MSDHAEGSVRGRTGTSVWMCLCGQRSVARSISLHLWRRCEAKQNSRHRMYIIREFKSEGKHISLTASFSSVIYWANGSDNKHHMLQYMGTNQLQNPRTTICCKWYISSFTNTGLTLGRKTNVLVFLLCQKIMKMLNTSFYSSKDCLQIACLVWPKVQNIQITTIWNQEKQKILTSEKLEPVNVWHYCLKRLQRSTMTFS